MITRLLCAGALVGSLGACAAPAALFAGPVEAVVAAEAGYPSYYEQGLDELCEAVGGTLPRDPKTGDCD